MQKLEILSNHINRLESSAEVYFLEGLCSDPTAEVHVGAWKKANRWFFKRRQSLSIQTERLQSDLTRRLKRTK
jgi:hypothetical protein